MKEQLHLLKPARIGKSGCLTCGRSVDDGEEQFLARMDTLLVELPANSAVAAFERASSLDSTGGTPSSRCRYIERRSRSGWRASGDAELSSKWPAHYGVLVRRRRASRCSPLNRALVLTTSMTLSAPSSRLLLWIRDASVKQFRLPCRPCLSPLMPVSAIVGQLRATDFRSRWPNT